jgi:DHA2 family multidrug resistance protein
MGYPALDSGLTLMPRSLAMALTMPIAGRLYNRCGPRLLVGIGMLVSGYSFWQLSRLNLQIGYMDILIPQALQGMGFGMVFVSITTSAMMTIDKSRMTGATGLYVVVRQIFGSIGIALVATELTRSRTTAHAALIEYLNPYRNVVNHWLHGAAGALAAQGTSPALIQVKALGFLEATSIEHAAMIAFNHVFFLLALLFVICFPLSFLLKSGKK